MKLAIFVINILSFQQFSIMKCRSAFTLLNFLFKLLIEIEHTICYISGVQKLEYAENEIFVGALNF